MGQSREGQIWSAADEVPIFYRTYPGQKSDYYYSIIHGFAEHSGRYTKLVECLQGTGRSVLVYDLRGHGRSGGERGGLTSWNQYWDVFHGLSAFLISRSELPASKTILLGHSLG
ncbi:MAG: alpha/beta fold hydrolase, partial [Candidatus Omnitrophica bacterium]|nr:alpha/beta fold hydrolase [Candidatus Omnitrophota bacterium]